MITLLSVLSLHSVVSFFLLCPNVASLSRDMLRRTELSFEQRKDKIGNYMGRSVKSLRNDLNA